MERGGHIQELRSSRSGALEVVVLAFVMAFGVNLIAASASEYLKDKWYISVIIGLFLISISLYFIASKLLPLRKREYKFTGVKILGDAGSDNLPINVDGYRFSEQNARDIDAICSENGAIRKYWKGGYLSGYREDLNGSVFDNNSPMQRIFRESVEYFILYELSMHLNAYFINSSYGNVVQIDRNGIPSILLENRFLELFSKPMEDREAFSSSHGDVPGGGRVIFAYGGGGAIFHSFELILPTGSRIWKSGNRFFIETPRFKFWFEITALGFGKNIDSNFSRFYLNKKWIDTATYGVDVCMGIDFKIISYITPSGWEYYQWIDSFIEVFERKFSFDRFLKDIGWLQARPILRALLSGSLDRDVNEKSG